MMGRLGGKKHNNRVNTGWGKRAMGRKRKAHESLELPPETLFCCCCFVLVVDNKDLRVSGFAQSKARDFVVTKYNYTKKKMAPHSYGGSSVNQTYLAV